MSAYGTLTTLRKKIERWRLETPTDAPAEVFENFDEVLAVIDAELREMVSAPLFDALSDPQQNEFRFPQSNQIH